MRTCGGGVRPSHQLYITYILIAVYQTTQPTLRTLVFYVFLYGRPIEERSMVLRFKNKSLMFGF